MRELERVVLLNITDTKWREHLYEMDYLQEGIHLRALAQQDPITEYRREAYDMFEGLTESIRADFVRYIYRVEFVQQGEEQARQQAPQPSRVQDNRAEVEEAGGSGPSGGGGAGSASANQAVSDKVPRNAPARAAAARSTRSATAPRSEDRSLRGREVSRLPSSWHGFSGPHTSSSAIGRNPRQPDRTPALPRTPVPDCRRDRRASSRSMIWASLGSELAEFCDELRADPVATALGLHRHPA